MENLGNGTISIGCSRGKEEKRKRRRVPVDITLARRRDVLQPRRGAHAGFIGRRERERERGREENLCEDSLAGGFTRDEKPNFSLFLFTLLPFQEKKRGSRNLERLRARSRKDRMEQVSKSVSFELEDYFGFVRGPQDRSSKKRKRKRERERERKRGGEREREREGGCEPILFFLFFTTRRVRASSNLASFYLLALGPAFLNANFGPADSVR